MTTATPKTYAAQWNFPKAAPAPDAVVNLQELLAKVAANALTQEEAMAQLAARDAANKASKYAGAVLRMGSPAKDTMSLYGFGRRPYTMFLDHWEWVTRPENAAVIHAAALAAKRIRAEFDKANPGVAEALRAKAKAEQAAQASLAADAGEAAE